MKRHSKGILNGAIASISYGTNPLFALPLYMNGIGVNSVLFYRYALAVIIYGLWLKLVKKVHLNLTKQEFFPLLVMGLLFSLSSLCLFEAFNHIEAGIACTILFIYPVLVAIIMTVFYKERPSKRVITAILLTSVGIIMLYNGKTGSNLSPVGVGIVFLSALFYALYIVGIKNIKTLNKINGDKISFYVMLFGLLVYIVNLKFCTELQILHSPKLLMFAILLAIVPTIISLETINIAIKLIGSTKTAILGALEPLTALFFGVTVFHEELTTRIIAGVALILTGVLLIVSINKKETKQT